MKKYVEINRFVELLCQLKKIIYYDLINLINLGQIKHHV